MKADNLTKSAKPQVEVDSLPYMRHLPVRRQDEVGAEVGGVGQGGHLVQRFLPGFQAHLPLLQFPVGGGGWRQVVAAGRGGGQLDVVLTPPNDHTDAVVKVGVTHLKTGQSKYRIIQPERSSVQFKMVSMPSDKPIRALVFVPAGKYLKLTDQRFRYSETQATCGCRLLCPPFHLLGNFLGPQHVQNSTSVTVFGSGCRRLTVNLK